ncbi:MAG TPA: lysophospholipid acyltransferase family protein, partial [Gammaproteobacteria bacterium]
RGFDITVKSNAFGRRFGHSIYGVYAWTALVIAVVPALVVLAVTPGRDTRRSVTRWFARVFFFSIGCPIGTREDESLPAGACVVVANHASYLDGIILTAALPPRFTFVIKHEMARLPFAGFLLRRIGSEFVKREDGRQKSQVARRLIRAADSGDALAFFPEGTFVAEPGLRRFHPGAFGAARRARVPVVPVAILGARSKLPAGSWLPAPGQLAIRVATPIEPDGHASASSLTLASRLALLEYLEEPDLGQSDRLTRSAQALTAAGRAPRVTPGENSPS